VSKGPGYVGHTRVSLNVPKLLLITIHTLYTKLCSRTVCGVNAQLDRLQQQLATFDTVETSTETLEQIGQLQDVIHSISVSSKTQPLLPPHRLADLLSDPVFSRLQGQSTSDHVWLVAAKATAQVSGLVMNALLDQTLEIQNETDYWNEMLGSVWYSSLYTLQKSPGQLFQWTKDAYMTPSITDRWAQFYHIARKNAFGGHSMRTYLLSPIRLCRAEMRQNRDILLAMKDLHTSSLGLLMEGCNIETFNGNWRDEIHKSVGLIEATLQQMALEPSTREFEQRVFAYTEVKGKQMQKPLDLIERLVHVLREKLPNHTGSMTLFVGRYRRPSVIVRYWLPVSLAILSGSVSTRFLVNRQDEIIQGIIDIGSTTLDFWGNWVVDPIRKLIGTIRHDEKSEIAIMSKNSLLADRASLERMVVDFVRDHPDLHPGVTDTAAIVNSVKEGDLTPVLKAYERDLRSPLVGTLRGDLIRALLIQIQKTKVDVEIAISGIDALLKSQELVFGYVL
jgi:nuclear-control-of-ATPase protein 2